MGQEAGFWDREELVGQIEKNATERIAVRRVERRGRGYVDIRVEWRRQDGDEFYPSKKGVVIPEEALDDILALLESVPKAAGDRRGSPRGPKGRSKGRATGDAPDAAAET